MCSKYDTLTGVLNRNGIDVCKNMFVKQSEIRGIYLNIKNFAWYNYEKGHSEGDIILQSLVYLIKMISIIRDKENLIFRIAGDEFIVFFPNLEYKEVVLIDDYILNTFYKLKIPNYNSKSNIKYLSVYSHIISLNKEEIFKSSNVNEYISNIIFNKNK